MSTIPADVSMIAVSATASPKATRRLPRAAGWMLTATVAGGLWWGAIELVRLAFNA